MAEVRDLLARPRVRRRFPALTDPKDALYINLAITARVSYLVSRDNDILDLANASTPDGERLGIRLLS